MDICVLNPYFHPYSGGTEKFLLEIYSRLAKRHNVCVVSAGLKPGEETHVDNVRGIRVVRLKTKYVRIPGLPLPFLAMEGVTEHIAEEGADIYHINNRYQYFYNAVGAIKRTGGKLAVTIHNSLPKGIGPMTDAGGMVYDLALGRRTIHSADIITGVSKDAIETTVPWRDRRRSKVIYNGVDHNRFRRRGKNDRHVRNIVLRLGLDRPMVLANGRLVQQKGLPHLIDGVGRMESEVDLVIIGRGPMERALYRRARGRGLRNRFRIVSGISESDLPYYYNAADAFALPSLYEPAGLALLEALSSETPSIATRIGGIPEMMGPGGQYVEPKDINGIGERIEFVLANRKKTAEMAAIGRKRMVRDHDWNKIARRYEELFEGAARR